MADQNDRYAAFTESIERQQKLADMGAAKALGLPWNEGVNISTNTQHGMPWWQVLILCGALFGGGAGLGSWLGWFQQATPAPPAAESQQYRVSFWAEDGTGVEVEELDTTE